MGRILGARGRVRGFKPPLEREYIPAACGQLFTYWPAWRIICHFGRASVTWRLGIPQRVFLLVNKPWAGRIRPLPPGPLRAGSHGIAMRSRNDRSRRRVLGEVALIWILSANPGTPPTAGLLPWGRRAKVSLGAHPTLRAGRLSAAVRGKRVYKHFPRIRVGWQTRFRAREILS